MVCGERLQAALRPPSIDSHKLQTTDQGPKRRTLLQWAKLLQRPRVSVQSSHRVHEGLSQSLGNHFGFAGLKHEDRHQQTLVARAADSAKALAV